MTVFFSKFGVYGRPGVLFFRGVAIALMLLAGMWWCITGEGDYEGFGQLVGMLLVIPLAGLAWLCDPMLIENRPNLFD